MTKSKFLFYAAATYCVLLIANNTIAGKTFDVFGFSWSSAFVTFPVVYILNDVFTEVYGFKTARKVVFMGFILNLAAVLVYQASAATSLAPRSTPKSCKSCTTVTERGTLWRDASPLRFSAS